MRKRLDVLMVILMMIVMSYQAVGNLFHEVAGASLCGDSLFFSCLWQSGLGTGNSGTDRNSDRSRGEPGSRRWRSVWK